MSIQVFSSDDPKKNTGLADTKITDTTEEEEMINWNMELIEGENEEGKNHHQLYRQFVGITFIFVSIMLQVYVEYSQFKFESKVVILVLILFCLGLPLTIPNNHSPPIRVIDEAPSGPLPFYTTLAVHDSPKDSEDGRFSFIPLDHYDGSKTQPNNAGEIYGRKRPNKRRELIDTVIYLLEKSCKFGSRQFIFSLIFRFLDVSVPENGIIDDAGVMPSLMELSSDYHWLVTAGSNMQSNNNFIKIWSMTDGSLKHDLDPVTLNSFFSDVHACLFTSDEKRLISAHARFVHIWSVTTGELIHTFPQSDSIKSNCILSPDGKYVLWEQPNASPGNHGFSVCMWSLETFVNVGIFRGHNVDLSEFCGQTIFWMNFRNFNQELITSGADKTIRVWDVETQECKRKLIGHSHYIKSCSLSQNQQFLVSGSYDKTTKIWNIDTEENIQTFYGHAYLGHTYQIEKCLFVNDDKWVASMDSSWTVYLWRVEDGSIVHTFNNTKWPDMGRNRRSQQSFWVHINTKIKPNENLLLTPILSPTELQVVDVESGRTMFMFNVNYNVCQAMIIDGRILMSSDHNAIRFWNLEKEAPNSDHQNKNKE